MPQDANLMTGIGSSVGPVTSTLNSSGAEARALVIGADVGAGGSTLNIGPGASLSASGISDDGLTIVGSGTNRSGHYEAWIATLPERLIGDADLDGYVDDDDLNLLISSWNQSGNWGNGDFSNDGFVDDDDLNLLLSNWHTGTPPPMGQGAIPEPATLSLLVFGAIFALRRQRR